LPGQDAGSRYASLLKAKTPGGMKESIDLMSAVTMLVANAEDGGGMHIFLLILLIVAIVLILAGATIAMFTLYYQRKTRAFDTHRSAKNE
jgi:flagellar basal body-associated protein FliL